MIHFVADIHLPRQADSKIEQAFLAYLENQGQSSSALYILGDLFDYWLGDGDLKHPAFCKVQEALAQFSRNRAVYFTAGNRDFLVGREFAKSCGLHLQPEVSVVLCDGREALILHGDELCTADVNYQRYRKIIRHPVVRKLAQHLPQSVLNKIAGGLRRGSQSKRGEKSMAMMDVVPQTVENMFRRGPSLMIHGHTHKPGHHKYNVDGRRCDRWVLGAWENGANYLAWDKEGIRSMQII